MSGIEFQTDNCSHCGDAPDESIPTLAEDVPGVTVVNRFCSIECRREYVDHRLEEGTAYESVADQLTDVGMDPTAFGQGMARDVDSKTEQDDSDSPRLFGVETETETEDETGEGSEGERESDRSTRSETTSMDEGTDQEDGDDRE